MKDVHGRPWANFAKKWGKYQASPACPSKNALKVYKSLIKKSVKKDAKALVLGATPQLRDLLFKMGLKVHIIDMSMDAILEMTKLMKNKNPDEVIMRSDWVDLPFPNDYFDVVVGDLIIANLTPDKQDIFLKQLKRVMKKNAHWITKVEALEEKRTEKDMEKLLEILEKIPASDTEVERCFYWLYVMKTKQK